MRRWLCAILIAFFLLPCSGTWAAQLPSASYQVPYCIVREGVHFEGSYAADLSTAYVHAYCFQRGTGSERFSLETLVQDHRVSYLSLVLYQGYDASWAQRFLYFLPPNRRIEERQGAGIRIDQLDVSGHDFLGRLMEDFWPMPVDDQRNPFWPLMMLFSPLVGEPGRYQPLSSIPLDDLLREMEVVLPVKLRVGTGTLEVAGQDLGRCNQLIAWGQGAGLGVKAADAANAFFEKKGWRSIPSLFASGRMGSLAGYRKGMILALVSFQTTLMPDVVINPNVPLDDQISDEAWLFELTISLAELRPLGS